MENKINKIKKTVRALAIKNNADLALIFGSYARGTNTRHSDLDVIFVERTKKPFLKRLDPYFDPLSEMMKSGVDVFVYTPHEFDNLKNNLFLKRALNEGVVVFESGKL
ncbi:MAG: nucleotidyltransferase domain-containing protein [Actinobacteria bacterium]|nr:nucleotidyltransferase domain-containing protein [Actinomycetota bacterium]